MKNTINNSILFAATLMFTFFAQASFANSTSLFAEFSQHCKDSACEAPYSSALVYDSAQAMNKLPAEVMTAVQKKAFAQAQIWGDTILEGDYFADGNTHVLRVSVLSKDNQPVGYKFTYAEKAWYTGDCDPGFDYKEVNSCQAGRIVESSFLTSDLISVENDFSQMAVFQPGK